jgi:ribokinase
LEHKGSIVVLGSANMDLVFPVERLALAGETIAAGDLALFPGGKGANQACADGR